MPRYTPPIATARRRRRRSGPPRSLLIAAIAIVMAVVAIGALLRLQPGAALKAVIRAARPSDSRLLSVRGPDLPLGLAAGTCVQYDPTAADRHKTIYVDPGHGGPDPGGVGVGLQEKDATLAVGLQLRDRLRADGFTVVMSRVTDTSVARLADSQVVNGAITASGVHVDTIARIDCANTAGADALVAIHFNAFHDPTASGSEIFYDDARDFSPQSLKLANALDGALQRNFTAAGWQVYDRGVLSDADTGNTGLTATADAYGRLMEIGPPQPGWNDHPSRMPGALVEPFFLTDPTEAAVAGSGGGQKAIATGLEEGLLAYFAPPPSPSPSAAS